MIDSFFSLAVLNQRGSFFILLFIKGQTWLSVWQSRMEVTKRRPGFGLQYVCGPTWPSRMKKTRGRAWEAWTRRTLKLSIGGTLQNLSNTSQCHQHHLNIYNIYIVEQLYYNNVVSDVSALMLFMVSKRLNKRFFFHPWSPFCHTYWRVKTPVFLHMDQQELVCCIRILLIPFGKFRLLLLFLIYN